MFRDVDTRDPAAVEAEIAAIHGALFPDGDRAFVPRAFGWLRQCFDGRFADYGPIDVRYHDLEHTLQGALCLGRLLAGRHRARAAPVLDVAGFELAMVAILFHDTGYLKRRDDVAGTGAKYTATHVERSAAFAREFLLPQGYDDGAVGAVQSMIRCTGIDVDVASIRFRNETERMTGYALGTADLLGQMAAADYVEKLPLLYGEFAEAARHTNGPAARFFAFASADELIRDTPGFWTGHVRHKIDREFGGLYAFLNEPWPDGPNAYVERIERNIARLPA